MYAIAILLLIIIILLYISDVPTAAFHAAAISMQSRNHPSIAMQMGVASPISTWQMGKMSAHESYKREMEGRMLAAVAASRAANSFGAQPVSVHQGRTSAAPTPVHTPTPMPLETPTATATTPAATTAPTAVVEKFRTNMAHVFGNERA
jgi:hypothetical protein